MEFGSFGEFCTNARIPACNLFDSTSIEQDCPLIGMVGRVTNLGSVIVDLVAVTVAVAFIWHAQLRRGAVVRREMQIFDIGYLLLSFFEIFSLGGFLSPDSTSLKVFSAFHVAVIPSALWVLFFSALTSMQWWNDGTKKACGAMMGMASVIFIATAWPALDTAFGWTLMYAESSETGSNSWLYAMYLICPLSFLVAYIVFQSIVLVKVLERPKLLFVLTMSIILFACGQVITFVLSNRICQSTDGNIDGTVFQSLSNLFAFVCVHILWVKCTNKGYNNDTDFNSWDRNEWNGDKQGTVTRDIEVSSSSESSKITPVYRTIVPAPKGRDFNKALDALDCDQSDFLDLVERKVTDLIVNSRRRDCCAIVQISSSGARTRYGLSDPKDWSKRFVKLARYDPGPNDPPLPSYEGNSTLDSYLSKPVVECILDLHVNFLQEHKHEVGQAMAGMLNDNPVMSRQLALQLAKSIRESAEPMSEKVYEALAHLLTEALQSGVGQQVGTTIGHVASHSMTASFSAAILHALSSALAKIMIKYGTVAAIKSAAMHAGGKFVAHIVLTTVFTALMGHLTVGGATISAGALAWMVLVPVVAAFAAYQVHTFPNELAEKVAPKVRSALAGENFREQNRSAMKEIFSEVMKDGGWALAKAMVGEMPEVKSAEHAAKECLKEAEERAMNMIRQSR